MLRFESVYLDSPFVPGRALDLFRPDEVRAAAPALFFVHGGGWHAGSRVDCHKLMEYFRGRGHFCAAADYRLNVTATDQLADLRESIRYFADLLAAAGHNGRIVIYGGSAGAHLAALLALAAPGSCGERVAGAAVPAAGLIVSAFPPYFAPWPNIFPPIAEAMRRAAGRAYPDDPELYRRLSPIHHVKASSCPVLNLHAANEHMFPLRHSLEFEAKMRDCGCSCRTVIAEDAEHGFFYDVTRECQQKALREVEAFLEKTDNFYFRS
ncbi:MAG: alpha/beta hydrolase [Victivallaceae bacterium]